MELPPPKRTLLGRFASWVQHLHALRAAIERARGRSPVLDAAFETVEHDSDLGGGMLAGALSYRLFVFALPLAFFVVSGLGVLASALGTQPHLVANSVGLVGAVTKQIESTSKASSSWWVALTSLSRVSTQREFSFGRSRSSTRWHGSARRRRSRCAPAPSGSSPRHSPANSCSSSAWAA
jgi:hypothetical protein